MILYKSKTRHGLSQKKDVDGPLKKIEFKN